MSDYGMVIAADARAMGAVNAINRGKRFMQKSRTSDYRTGNRAGECVSYYRDDNGAVINATVFKPARTRKPNRRRNVVTVSNRVTIDRELMLKMGTIHEAL